MSLCVHDDDDDDAIWRQWKFEFIAHPWNTSHGFKSHNIAYKLVVEKRIENVICGIGSCDDVNGFYRRTKWKWYHSRWMYIYFIQLGHLTNKSNRNEKLEKERNNERKKKLLEMKGQRETDRKWMKNRNKDKHVNKQTLCKLTHIKVSNINKANRYWNSKINGSSIVIGNTMFIHLAWLLIHFLFCVLNDRSKITSSSLRSKLKYKKVEIFNGTNKNWHLR